MPLQPLNQVLHSLRTHPMWQEQRQFQLLLQCWPEIVGSVVGAQTRPLSISRQRVLRVATSSAVWAQNLAFERHLILEKLNQRLSSPLIDIQFSAGQWRQPTSIRKAKAENLLSQPSPRSKFVAAPQRPQDSQAAFQQWAKTIQARSQQLPLCPQCRCPTPPEELQRWRTCGLCAVKTMR